MADISVIKMPNNQSYNLKDATARESIAALPTDVQVDGNSIVNNNVANVPIADNNGNYGLIKINLNSAINGLAVTNNGLTTFPAATSLIKEGSNAFRPICPEHQHESVFYGLTKVAGVDMASSSNTIGTYTEEAKTAIQTMLGAQAAIEVIRL